MSYICCEPIAGISVKNGALQKYYPDGTIVTEDAGKFDLINELEAFSKAFSTDKVENYRFISGGLFGYFTHEIIEHFEDIELKKQPQNARLIPELQYHIYKYIIAVDHFKNELYIFEALASADENTDGISKIEYLIQNSDIPKYQFKANGLENSNLTDDEFKGLVNIMKTHIYRGDVFQIVPSRAFSLSFMGDEFNVYRSLRSINPSPYLFYFDYGSYKIFGSSPEAQLTIQDKTATIYPIAGTFKRTGNDQNDQQIALALQADPKESAEHVMLVDLARNDLSRHCNHVEVKAFKEVQFYSHLIHLVSKVSGKLKENTNPFNVVADTFPAGTLSGAPKYRAMELIDQYEKDKRSFYSGAIGFMDFEGNFNHAIMIRSFLSKENRLHYQAGAGIVAGSDPESELNEVNNKIAALRNAIRQAEKI